MSRPNFSGRWQFDPVASTLQITIPDSVELAIEHQEPFFHLERALAFGDRSDTFSIDLAVGTAQPPFSRGDATIWASLRWDGDDLAFVSKILRTGEEAINSVRYRLEGVGSVLIAEECYRSPTQSYDNRWVFRRSQRHGRG